MYLGTALNTYIFQWLFRFNFLSFQMNTEILMNPSIHKQPAVGKVQARRSTKAASQSRLRINCRHIMPYCQGQQLTAGDRAPDVGAIWFPVATGFSGMEGEVVCSAPPLHGVVSAHLRSLWFLREFPLFREIFSCVLLCIVWT